MENATARNLYWFFVINGSNGRDREGENMIKQFIEKGHQFDNLYIFTSQASLEDIHSFIKENKMEDFMYLLVDMTNNVTSDTFKTIINKEFYRPAEKFIKLLREFKPESETDNATNFQQLEKRRDEILDIISQKGIKALEPKQKEFLDNFSKGKFNNLRK